MWVTFCWLWQGKFITSDVFQNCDIFIYDTHKAIFIKFGFLLKESCFLMLNKIDKLGKLDKRCKEAYFVGSAGIVTPFIMLQVNHLFIPEKR